MAVSPVLVNLRQAPPRLSCFPLCGGGIKHSLAKRHIACDVPSHLLAIRVINQSKHPPPGVSLPGASVLAPFSGGFRGGRSSGGRALLSLSRNRSSAGIAHRSAGAGGGRSRSGNNYTTAAAHHRPLSLFINPSLRGVLRGWRPPGRGEGMEPARDAPCPRSGPAGGCTEAAARWCQAPRLGLRRGQPWALRQVPARSRGKQPGLCPCVFTPVRTVTNGAAGPPVAARGRGQRPPSGLSHSRGPPVPGPTCPELPWPRRVKVGKERSSCGGLRREQEAPPGTLELVFGLGLLAACSKKRSWLTRRRHAPLKNTNQMVVSEEPGVLCHGNNLIINRERDKPNLQHVGKGLVKKDSLAAKQDQTHQMSDYLVALCW